MSLNMFPTVGEYLTQTQDALTDSSGGTANTTLQAIGATYAQAEVANNFADVAAQLAKIRTDIAAIMTALNRANGG